MSFGRTNIFGGEKRNISIPISFFCYSDNEINYTSGRKLNKDLISRLSTCEFIREGGNIFITGATGSGKTYMACAFGYEACRQFYTTRFVRLPDLLIELEMAKENRTFTKAMLKYTKPTLLIIDEWLLLKPSENE